MDKKLKRHFWTTYPPDLVDVVIEWPLRGNNWALWQHWDSNCMNQPVLWVSERTNNSRPNLLFQNTVIVMISNCPKKYESFYIRCHKLHVPTRYDKFWRSIKKIQSHISNFYCMFIFISDGKSACDHVGIINRLHLNFIEPCCFCVWVFVGKHER